MVITLLNKKIKKIKNYMSSREIMNAQGFGKEPKKKSLINRIKTWWKDFIKKHIIDEIDPNDLDF